MILLWKQPDELPSSKVPDDGAGDWLAIVGKCGAAVAISATMALALVTNVAAQNVDLQQDDPAGKLHGQFEDDSWQNPVRPVPGTNRRLYLPDGDDVPAGRLFGQYDEDFWPNRPLEQAPRLLPVAAFTDDEIIVQQPVTSVEDEDFYSNPVAPIPARNWQSLPYFFDDASIAYAPITAPPEEDFWSPIIPPARASIWQRLPYLPDPEEIPAGTLYGIPEEDLWSPQPRPSVTAFVPFNQWNDDQFTSIAPTFDEDYPFPVPPAKTVWRSGIFSIEDERPFASVDFDEDYPFASTIWPMSWQARLFSDDDILPILRMDEDFWINPVAPVTPWKVILPVDTDDTLGFVPIDEDFDWNFSYGPRAEQAAIWQKLPLAIGWDEIHAKFTIPDWLVNVYSSVTPTLVCNGALIFPVILATEAVTIPSMVCYKGFVAENKTYMPPPSLLPFKIQVPFIFFPGNTVPVLWSLIVGSTWDTTDTPVTDAIGTLTILDANQNPVTGANGVPFVSAGTAGEYSATIDGNVFDPPEGQNYTTVIEFTSPSLGAIGTWSLPTVIRFRTTP